MEDLFERIKSEVPILPYVEDETGLKSFSVGSSVRVNPCPLCGHNDCFTVYADSFCCFSCGRGGDVICFERHHSGFESNLEAAQSIAHKCGLAGDRDTKSPAKPSPRKSTQSPSRTPDPKADANYAPALDEAKAEALRAVAAEFYHQQLLNTPEALDYQVKQRGHSLEVLKQFKVGYSNRKSLIAHIRDSGDYNLEDLIAVGLAVKEKKEVRPVVASGYFVYPHWIRGRVVYFSLKPYSGDQKIFSIKKAFAGPDWLCLGQDALAGKEIIAVEGENDFFSIVDKAGVESVICTRGAFNEPNILQYLQANSRGKTVFLCFDRDEAGSKYSSKYGKAVAAGGGSARVVAIPEPHKDIDDVLRESEKPDALFQKMLAEAYEFAPAEPDDSEHPEGNGNKSGSLGPFDFESFKAVGEDEDGRIVFWSNEKKKPYIVSLRELDINQLVQIGGDEVRTRVANRNAGEGQVLFRTLKKHLIVEAGKTQLGQLHWFGQGVNKLNDGRLLVVNGDQAHIWDGRNFEPYEAPLIERRLINRRPGREWIDFGAVIHSVSKMTRERAEEISFRALNLVAQWGFAGGMDVPLVAGFMFAQFVQSIWNWRPHLWLTGKQGSGKTLLIQLYEAIGGELSMRREGQVLTEAGFRQEIGNESRIVLIDEFEKSDGRQQIVEYLRSANKGGVAVKGSVNQTPVYFHIRHMVLVGSIEVGLVRAAEKSRFIVIELAKDVKRDPKVPNSNELESLRIEFFSLAIWLCFKAKKLIHDLGRFGSYEGRFIECYAVPLSMLALVYEDPLTTLTAYVTEAIQERENQKRGACQEQLLRGTQGRLLGPDRFPADRIHQ